MTYTWRGDPALAWRPRGRELRACGIHSPWSSTHRQGCEPCRGAYSLWLRVQADPKGASR